MFKPIESDEEYEKYLRDVVGPTYDAVMNGTAELVTSEELDAVMREWDREDGIEDDAEPLKRSA